MDFSASSDGALTFAKKLARKFSAELHIIHVIDDPTRAIAAIEQLLDAHVIPEDRVQLSLTTAVLHGPIAATIVSYAGVHRIDLIVMGAEGQGQHGLLGRVVERVVRLGPCPVLTVKEEPPSGSTLV